MSGRFRLIVSLCILFASNSIRAQHNVYVNENNRTCIVNGVDMIAYEPDNVMLWSDTSAYSFNVTSVSLMSLKEKDSWRSKVMPERYLADFDYDISFADQDRERMDAEPEVTDEKSKFYDDFVTHNTWSKTVNVVYDGDDVSVTGDTDSLTLTQQGAHLTVRTAAKGVRYIISGNSDDACFKLYSEKKACVVLNGANLTNPQGPVINSQLKKRLFIVISANSVNTLTDGAEYV